MYTFVHSQKPENYNNAAMPVSISAQQNFFCCTDSKSVHHVMPLSTESA